VLTSPKTVAKTVSLYPDRRLSAISFLLAKSRNVIAYLRDAASVHPERASLPWATTWKSLAVWPERMTTVTKTGGLSDFFYRARGKL